MKDKVKGLISKYKEFDNDKKSGYFYGIIFILILVMALIMKFTSKLDTTEIETNNNTNQEQTVDIKTTDYDEILNKILNNYEEDIIVYFYETTSYADLNLNSKNRQLTNIYKKEFINIKKDNDIKKETYIDLKNSKVEELSNDIDTTFITPENIKKLISSYTYKIENKFMIETTNWIKIYNEITNKNIEKQVTGELEVTIHSYNTNELKLSLNLTNLYKNINQDYTKVIYDINFYNIDNVYLSNAE